MHYPFSIDDLVHLDDALTYGSRASGARFAVYIGDLGSDTGARAREILAEVPTPNDAVLIAVSPDQHAIEVVYGSAVRGRGAESAAPLGVAAAAASFNYGNLIDGLISAVRVTSAGISPAYNPGQPSPAPSNRRARSDLSMPARPSNTSRRSAGGSSGIG